MSKSQDEDEDPRVWGPHYWFFLHTMARTYPDKPNDVIKRKYYDLLTNFPLFIPHRALADQMASWLDKFPVQPYLASRASLEKWVLFLHNKVNRQMGKDELTMEEATLAVQRLYKPPEYLPYANREWLANTAVIVVLLVLVSFLRG